jgi:hypothetical protein
VLCDGDEAADGGVGDADDGLHVRCVGGVGGVGVDLGGRVLGLRLGLRLVEGLLLMVLRLRFGLALGLEFGVGDGLVLRLGARRAR